MDSTHARKIMEFLSVCELTTDEGVTLHSIMDYCGAAEMSFEDVQDGLVLASRRGWIALLDDQFVHLTEAGYVLIHVANDNPPDKG